jgi:hypothetical protein
MSSSKNSSLQLGEAQKLMNVDRYCAVLVVFIGNVGQFPATTNN